MKQLFSFGIAVLTVIALNVFAWADDEGAPHPGKHRHHHPHHPHKHKHNRSNKGGAVRGEDRAEQVQQENTKADENRGFTTAPGLSNAPEKPAGQ